ncbi:MAG: tRNA (adenosine(37)-N6)-dimethylallyltransferase MiaA [Clostridiales bacterium GWC2_40_7]|nr:MAG: tRNA (adenosine(37)-N6)-dimethylallyltransferase MiaA [Clostridiales bacterium GWC2_40_7]
MEPVIVIVGPTASGKTSLSIELAKRINGEIISADSMQIYRYMDIGTAKPDADEMSGIKHYLIDEIYPDEEFSVAKYRELAIKYINKIIKEGRHPVIAGGTGLYINSLVYNINFSETISDWPLREQLKKESEEKGSRYLHNKLMEIDPEAAVKIHENDIKRIIRAIEVFKHTNKPISLHQQLSRLEPPPYNYLIFGLRMERARLYERIEKRVDIMFERGLVNEVRKLQEMGYERNITAMQGLGYKEIFAYLRGEATLDEAKFIIKRDTRHYAKRQLTWFKRLENIHWMDVDEDTNIKKLVKNIEICIASSGIFL